jgi:hypothetical protein
MSSIDQQTIQSVVFNILKYNPYSKYTIDNLQNILQFNFLNNGYEINFETNQIINEYLDFLVQNSMILKFQEIMFSNNKKTIPYFTYSYHPNHHTDFEISLLKQSCNEYDKFTLSIIKFIEDFDEDNELNYQFIMSIVNDINEKINSIPNINDVKDLIDKIEFNIENINKEKSEQISILHVLYKNNLLRIKELFEKNEKFEQQIDYLKKINIDKNKQIQELKEINDEKNHQIKQLKDMHFAQKNIAHQQTEKINKLEREMEEMKIKMDEKLSVLEEQGKKKRFYFF